MTQQDRDRLVALKKARKGLITQRQAAAELDQSERHIRRLLKQLDARGDAALVHALRGRPSNRKLDDKTRRKALEILGRDVYRGFGPTLAAERLVEIHGLAKTSVGVDRRPTENFVIGLGRGEPREIDEGHFVEAAWRTDPASRP